MTDHIVKHKIGLPVWDGDRVVDIKHFYPGSTISTEDFEGAKQDEDEQAMLVEHNTFTDEELKELESKVQEAEKISAFVTDADEPLPSQEER